MVTEKELYQRKIQDKVNQWKAELGKLQALLAGADADARLIINEQSKN